MKNKYLSQCQGVGSHNKNDCTIQTLVNTTLQPYYMAKELAEFYGMTPKGLNNDATLQMFYASGFTIEIMGRARGQNFLRRHCDKEKLAYVSRETTMTLGAWFKTPEAQNGIYAINVNRHIFAVRDGVIFDQHKNKATARIQAVYKLSKGKL